MNVAGEIDLAARILAKTNEYLDFPSVVGHETPFLDHLARDFAGLGFSPERHANLCVIDTGRPGPVFLAHVDRHGAVIAPDGAAIYAAHAVKNEKYGEQAVASEILAARVNERYGGEEVFAYDRKTGGRLAYGDVSGARLDGEGRIVLDIAGLPSLSPGTPVSFARALDRSAGGQVSGQLDNPVSVAVLRIAAELGLSGIIVFTAEEEIGRSAAHFLAWATARLKARKDVLALDTSPFDDSAAMLAGAVILRRRDASASFNETMVERVERAAAKAGAPIIFKDAFIEAENAARARRGQPLKGIGMTELGKIAAQSKGEFTGASLQVPTVNYHSNQETTSPRALVAMLKTALAVCEWS
ncbi:MAG: hypothetical protein ACQRW7_03235 [Caulobacterales bacterium]|uniref:hypothetical protein n=1 Tax=Glycocaulis sp. TaxID=1969725 RepID=UPI003FA0004F